MDISGKGTLNALVDLAGDQATRLRADIAGDRVRDIKPGAVSEQEKADLIAICSHGRGGLARLFYGSVASGVLNRADRPLLVIRARNDIE